MGAESTRPNGTTTEPVAAEAARPPRAGAAGEMPAEHALLGLIVRAGGEAHGYELARHFEPTHPLGDVLRLEQAMLYQHLKKLERRGWLAMTVQPQESRPPRRVYRITDEGRAELRRWLEEPVARTREIRLEFLVKLFFAVQSDPALARRLVAEQLAVCQQLVASLEGQMASLGEGDGGEAVGRDEAAFEHIVLELRRDQTRAAAAWLERVGGWIEGT